MHLAKSEGMRALRRNATVSRALLAPPRIDRVPSLDLVPSTSLQSARGLASTLLKARLGQIGWAWRLMSDFTQYSAARQQVVNAFSSSAARVSLRISLTCALPHHKFLGRDDALAPPHFDRHESYSNHDTVKDLPQRRPR